MFIVYIILIVIGSLVALFLIAGLFAKKNYTITRSVTINCPKNEVFEYVRFMRNQDNYSKWNMADPNMKRETKGTDGTEGFYYAWDSTDKQVGKGEQWIRKITPGERVDYDIHFIRPFEGRATADISMQAEGNQTLVTWTFNNAMTYPMNTMGLIINFDKLLGNDLMTGLNNLKHILEKH